MKEETKKLIKCFACGFSMSGNGFCDQHSTSGIGYFWLENEKECRDLFLDNPLPPKTLE